MRTIWIAVAALLGGALLLAGGGVALAQHGGERAESRCEARLARVAERRGLTVAELEAQVRARLLARVAAAEQSGRIDAEHAA
ncbi:MAG TPA: hypothetical protein VNJ53_03310, partial [Gaiellaceae bacterium]|nr:hypothetical protein [Gaiellaceae bacterium]